MLTTNFIQNRLAAVAAERGVRLRYACESGSRAWGLASTDSDYDVRFIYQHSPEWYLQLAQPKDMIGPLIALDGELDLVGWDIRKVLRHVAGSNAGVIEWLHSPVHYYAEDDFLARLRELATMYFQPAKVAAHYLGVARSAEKAGYDAADDTWNLKKFCYFLRPVFAARHVIATSRNPPVAFTNLLTEVEDAAVRTAISGLIALKEEVSEAHRLRIPGVIGDYVARTRDAGEVALRGVARRAVDWGAADGFFREVVGRG